jgi:putative flippase GtrA
MRKRPSGVALPAELAKAIPVSFASFLLDYALLYALTEWAHWHYLLSAACSFVAGNALNYVLLRVWVYPQGQQGRHAYLSFVAIGAGGLALNELLLYFFSGHLGAHYMLGKVLAATLVFFYNFILRRYLVFHVDGLKK